MIGDPAMKFPDDTFDVVLSNLCLTIPRGTDAAKSCACETGGRAIISDFKKTANYLAAFRSAGAVGSRGGFDFLHTFPPLRTVEISKR